MTGGHLQIVACGAGPATDVRLLIAAAHASSWTTAVTATIAALAFLDVHEIEEATGTPVRTSYQTPATGRRVLPTIDALIIAPATYNTINKLARGIADTYPLSSVAELIGCGVPAVIVPFVNAALAARAPFQLALTDLRDEGVRILSGSDEAWEPHAPGTGIDARASFPWQRAFQIAAQAAGRRVR